MMDSGNAEIGARHSTSGAPERASESSWITKETLASVVKTHGTPTFVYSEERLLENGRRLQTAVKNSGLRNPIKTFVPFFPNSNPHLFRPLQSIGMGAMIQLPSEHTILSRFGIKDFIASIGHLSNAEIDAWVEIGCPMFLSSLDEVEYLIKTHPTVPIQVRFDCLSSDKPGVKYGQLNEFRKMLTAYDRELDSFELYCGSSVTAEEMAGVLEQVFMVYRTHFPNVRSIDFAGGYGFDYGPLDQDKKHFDWDRYFRDLKNAVERYGAPDSVEFWYEPARDIFADAGVLVLSVERLVVQPGHNQLLVDGSRVLMPSAKMKDRNHNVLFFDEDLRELPPGEGRALLRGRGILRNDHLLPNDCRIPDGIKARDLAVILDVGAYCATQHMEFLNIPNAPEVLVDSSGRPNLITRRGDALDKWRNVVGARATVAALEEGGPGVSKSSARPRAAPIRSAVMVSVPARSAVSVFDMNTFAPGVPGGGNLGIALSIYTKIAIRRRRATDAPSGDAARANQRVLFDHCVSVWASRVGDAGPYDLEVLETPMQHVGLASSSAFQAAVYAGLNWLDGSPLAESQLLELLYSSYKEAEDGGVVDGFTTGLSGFLNFYGGFVALDTDLRPLRHFALPAWSYVVAVPRGWASSAFGEEEVKLLMGEGKRLDTRDRDEKRRLLDAVVLPALERRDLGAFGRGVNELQQLGNKRCEILLHGERMEAALRELSSAGVECVFLSAIGPAIVLLSERSLSSLAPVFERLELDATYSGKVDSVGLVISSVDSP